MKLGSHSYTLLASLIALCFMCLPLVAAADAASYVTVTDPYVRAVAPGQKKSAAFMKLSNADNADHAVVSADSDAAGVVELVIDRIAVPAGGKTILKPGGLHVMLIDLIQPLKPGEKVSVTLVFEDGSRKEVLAPVRE